MTLRVSVVVPTYRRPELLLRCLAALAAQTLDPSEYEVIVADDGADDSTRGSVEAFAGAAAARIHYRPVRERHGPAAARNEGARAARAPVIAFTDDDCLPDANWLREGLAAIEAGADAAGGRIVVPLPQRPTDFERDTSGLERAEFATANVFCRRAAFEEVGGFEESFTAAWREDSDLHFQLLRAGYSVGRAERAVVVHPARAARWGVSLWHQRKTQFNALLRRRHPELCRQRIERFPRDYFMIVASLVAAPLAYSLGQRTLAAAATAAWFALTARFCARRLAGASRRPSHIAEMIVTSCLIPPLSLFWHLRGIFRFRHVRPWRPTPRPSTDADHRTRALTTFEGNAVFRKPGRFSPDHSESRTNRPIDVPGARP